jgi:Predicted membrane protein
MNFAAADLHLAIAHHLLIFLLAGILAFEIGVIRLTMTGADIDRVGRVDAWYGILALAIVAVGFSRAIFAAKGWAITPSTGSFGRRWRHSPRWGCCRLSPQCGS